MTVKGAILHVRILVFAYCLVALAAFYWMMKTEGASLDIAALSVFVLAAWLAEALYIRVSKSVMVSASFAIGFAALVALGPLSGALTLAVTAFDYSALKDWRNRIEKILFNSAQLFVGCAAAGSVYLALGGTVGFIERDELPWILIAVAAATLVQFALNLASVALVVKVSEGVKFRAVLSQLSGANGVLQHITLTILGVLLAQIFGLLNAIGLLLLAIPLLVSRQVHAVYVSHKAAYLDALGALVGALEAKDSYTKGHSDRVSAYSVKTGAAMGLSDKDLDDLRMAGLLHDIGKIAVKGSILRKPGKLSEEEYGSVKDHAEIGAGIVDHIKLLSRAIPGVKYHHERVDGLGYGTLVGDEIPLIAKILCVADAYDSMTSKRSYREPVSKDIALTELKACAGSQFDPNVVEHFSSVLAGSHD